MMGYGFGWLNLKCRRCRLCRVEKIWECLFSLRSIGVYEF